MDCYCRGKGTVRATRYGKGDYVFKCSCGLCTFDYPVWGEEWTRKGFWLKKDVNWNEEDDYQVKGLALLITDEKNIEEMNKNKVWRLAPDAIKNKAWQLHDKSWKPTGTMFDEVTPF